MKNKSGRTPWESIASRLVIVGLLTVFVLLFAGCDLTGEAGGRAEGTKTPTERFREAKPTPRAGKEPVTPARERELKPRTLVSPDTKAGETGRESVRPAPATPGAKTGKKPALPPLPPTPDGAEASLPDLTVDLSLPSSMMAGDTAGASISAVANNIGSADAPGKLPPGTAATGYGIDLYIAPTASAPPSRPVYSASYSDYVLLQGGRASRTHTLAPGSSFDYSSNLSISRIPDDTPAGHYYVCAWIDAGELVPEEDELNNITCQLVTIAELVLSLPDLTVDLTIPTSAGPGDEIGGMMSVVANNIGSADASGKLPPGSAATGYSIDLYIAPTASAPPSRPVYSASYSDYVLLRGGRVSGTYALAPGANFDYSSILSVNTIPGDTLPGAYYVCAWIDAGQLVPEEDETNNLNCQPITIESGVPVGDFTIRLASRCAVVSPAYDGYSQSVVVSMERSGGHSSVVSFGFSGDSGITGTFSPASLSGSGDGTTVLTLAVDSALSAGGYTVSVDASDGVTTHTEGIDLTLLGVSAGSGLSFAMSTLSAGGSDTNGFTLSVKTDGTVQSWGSNQYGELGNNDFGTDSNTPVEVLGPDGSTPLASIVTVAAGHSHGLALREDGTVWSWGFASEGQLGTGNDGFPGITTSGRSIGYVPFAVPVCGLTDVVAIAAGNSHSLALDSGGQVYSFGNNTWGQLGDGTTASRTTPAEVKENATDIFADTAIIAAGHFHSLAVATSGNAYAWGRNEYGGLGNLAMGIDSYYPVAVQNEAGVPVSDIVDIDGGYAHSLALDSSGAVYGWGDNYWGQLADTSMDTTAPHGDQARDYSDEVTALSAYTVTDVEAGGDNSLVISSGGEVLGFGWGTLGQNGDGNAAERDYTPVAAVFPSSTVDPVSVSAMGSHVAVLSQNSSGSDGTVYVFGDDRVGQLGIGGASDSCTLGSSLVTCEKTPVMVSVATQVMLP